MNKIIVDSNEGMIWARYEHAGEWLLGDGDTEEDAIGELQEEIYKLSGSILTEYEIVTEETLTPTPPTIAIPKAIKKDAGWITLASDEDAWKVICIDAMEIATTMAEGERDCGIIDIRSGVKKDTAIIRYTTMVNKLMRAKKAVGAFELLKDNRTYLSFTDIPNPFTMESRSGSGVYREANTQTINGNVPVPGQCSYSSASVSLITGTVQELDGPDEDELYERIHLKDVGFSKDEVKAIERKSPETTRIEAIEGIEDKYLETLQRSHTLDYTRWTRPGQDLIVVQSAALLRMEAEEAGHGKNIQSLWYAVGYCRGIRDLKLPPHTQLEAHLKVKGIEI